MNKALHDSMLDIVGRIHDFVLDTDVADSVIEEMATVLDSDKAILMRLTEDRRRDIALGYFGVDRDFINGILRERENPENFLSHELHWTPGSVATDNDCKRAATRRRETKFFRELLQPNGIEHTLLGVIDSSDIHHVLLWFHRDEKRGPFGRAEKRFLESTMPHWQRAIRQKLMYDYHHSALSAAGVVLDQSPFGLFIIGRDGRVLYTNAAAKNQCKANAGMRLRNQRLIFGDREIRGAFEDMLAAARHGGREDDPRLQPISMEKANGGGSYQIGLRRLQLPALRGSLATRKVAALYVYDTEKRMELSVSGLKSLYTLTDAEARVCELLYKSRNLPEAAKILGISINTAKTHLNRSFRKVGVQSQAELVRRLNSQLYIS